ncbi:hypothetical protein JTB14_007275 [Gonioctena quinquepunctata]|nr:hypothetical protein JTB14_007275 [Gonioctena quinquepunctata]
MVCRKSDVRLFSVSKNYGAINHTVGDDMVEIYGDKVTLHIKPDSVVCNVCMNILDNMVQLMRNMWSIISDPNEQPKTGHFVKLYKIFSSVKIEDDVSEELQNSRNKALTPSKLLKLAYTDPYRKDEEDHMAEQERLRSISRGSTLSNASEVRSIFKRKRGRPKSINSDATSRPTSVSSYRSTTSSRSTSSRRSPRKQIVEYNEEGRLTRKRTRSVSRAQEEIERFRERIEDGRFYCLEKDCTLYFKDLDVLNLHKIMDHELLALYYCEECQQRYTTLQHLKLHLQIHDIYSFFCLMCGCELENRRALQSHLDEHMVYSVPCKYCDKTFLSRHLCENHIKTSHRGKRNRRIHKEKLIVDRVDSRSGQNGNNVMKKYDYRVEYIYHTDMEYESKDMDVTVENMKSRNIEFHPADDDMPFVGGKTFDGERSVSDDEPLPDDTSVDEINPEDDGPLDDRPSDDSELITGYSPTPS